MPTMRDLLLQHQLHQFLCRRGHVLETLAERNDGKAHAFQILNHLHGAPAVESDLPDIKPFTQPFDKLLNAMQTYNVNIGYEHVVDWAQQNKAQLTAQQIERMVDLAKKSKVKKAIKLCEQYF